MNAGAAASAAPSAMAAQVRLRPEEPADDPFLLLLYASTREPELALAPWSEADKAAFIRSQFDLQRAHYRQYYPGAAFDVVVCGDEPAGRLYVHRGPAEIRIIDLAIVPRWRGRGIGTALLSALAAEADAAGRLVSLHVESEGRARLLYERMGFELRDERGPYLFLERPPRTPVRVGADA